MKKKIVSILIIFIIILMIIGIWVIKNNQKQEENTMQETEVENPDFALRATQNFNLEKLKSYKLPIIIDFGASYCQPCRQMSSDLNQINIEYQESAIVKYVDIERYPEIASPYPIEFIPTQLLICSDGTPYKTENKEELELQYIQDENGTHVATLHYTRR